MLSFYKRALKRVGGLALTAVLSSYILPVCAASLQVAPILLEVPAGQAATTLTLTNEGLKPLDAQVRVFSWKQIDGRDVYTPATDVIVSPPTLTMEPRTDYTVRVIRTSSEQAQQEEAYRVVVDELPDPLRARGGAVQVLLRHSVPLFFSSGRETEPRLVWKTEKRGQNLVVTAQNMGSMRARITQLQVMHGQQAISFGQGLVGYALGHSTMTWQRPLPSGMRADAFKVHAKTDSDQDLTTSSLPSNSQSQH